jgi:hypothetical protein
MVTERRKEPPQGWVSGGSYAPLWTGHPPSKFKRVFNRARDAGFFLSAHAGEEGLRAAEARKEADRLACVAWNQRMLGFKGPAQPSPGLGDALSERRISLS